MMRRVLNVFSMVMVICMALLCAACTVKVPQVSSGSLEDSVTSIESQSSTPQSSVTTSSSSTPSSSSEPPIIITDPPYWPSQPDIPPKKEVYVLMPREYTATEIALINSYTKKNGVKVRTTVATETDYAVKLVSLISGMDSPDVVCLSAGGFPGFVTKSLQPLDVQTFKLNDAIWNKTYMDYYKVNGRYFGVAISGSPACETGSYCTYYNPDVLRACGITTMPYDLYKQGKWDWDAQRAIAARVVAKSPDNAGMMLQNAALLMHSAGADFVKYDGKEFVNTLGHVKDGDLLAKSWVETTTLRKNGLSGGYDLKKFTEGKAGLFTAQSYGLFKESIWFDGVTTGGGAAGLQAVPLAGPKGRTAYTPISAKLWGVAKGSDNVQGAYYFLRYFLDPSNTAISNMVYNAQFGEIYNKITSKSVPKSGLYSSGLINYVNQNSYETLLAQLVTTQPDNIVTVLNQKKTVVDTGVKRANSDLRKIK